MVYDQNMLNIVNFVVYLGFLASPDMFRSFGGGWIIKVIYP